MKKFIFFILFVILLFSCSTPKFEKNGYFIFEENTYYCNDSLPIYIKLSGEYNNNNNNVINSEKLKKHNAKLLKKLNISLENKTILFSGISPLEERSTIVAILIKNNFINTENYQKLINNGDTLYYRKIL